MVARLAALVVATAAMAGLPPLAAASKLVVPNPLVPVKPFPLKPPAGSVNASVSGLKADLVALAGRVFPPGPQVDVPINYAAYFDTSFSSDCMPPNDDPTDPSADPDRPTLGFSRSCPLDVPWSDPTVAHTVPGCSPDQVAVKWWGTAVGGPAALISWASCDSTYAMPAQTTGGAPPPRDPATAPSGLRTGSKAGVYEKAWPATDYSYTMDYSPAGGAYVSPVLHHALVRGLTPGEVVHYRIDGPPGSVPFTGAFRVPGGFPLRVAAGADLGMVVNLTVSFAFWAAVKPDLVLLPGDLTYADNTKDWNMYYDWAQAEALYQHVNTFSPRWDAWGRLISPLASAVPILTAPGNHEIEPTPENAQTPWAINNWNNTRFLTRFANYMARYPAPQTDAQALHGPTAADLAPITPGTDEGRGLFYATEVPGVATIISLSTYTFTDTYTASDPQYQWLAAKLAAVDRVKTPWLVIQMHASFYSTALPHAMEAECMRQLYEPLFNDYGVDLVFSGHDHDYERAGPVFNYGLDPKCGTIYLTVGNPGGDEINDSWMDKWATYMADPSLLDYSIPFGLLKANTCAIEGGEYNYQPPPYTVTQPGQWGPGGRCVTEKIAASGYWCADAQPPFSRFRVSENGAGFIDFLSPTKAVWRYYSHARGLAKPADEVVITRRVECASKKGAGGGGAKEAVAAFAGGLEARAEAGKGPAVLDVKGGAAGIKRGLEDQVAAVVALANFTLQRGGKAGWRA